jgi:FkbM family methyltransferase
MLRRLRQDGLRHWVECAGTDPRFASQYGQDHYIWEHLLGARNEGGVFVDIGAYDGVTFSNTAFFERVLGWTGLLIEPNPIAFGELKQQRNADAANCGVAPEECVLEFLQCNGYGSMLSCFPDFASPEHLKRVEEAQGEHGFEIERFAIPVKPIAKILEEHEITRADLLSLDVEGMEISVLESFPFTTVPVRICVVEANAPGPALERLMESRGFVLVAIIGTDHVYVSRE